jgi:phage I-like protein
MADARIRVLAIELGAEPPTEFRIFRAGVNDTTKGPALFDDQAAAAVIAAYREHGVDLMIDLEHSSVDAPTRRTRADATDALGWFGLEVRNGELWAVNVTWTDDGAARLAARKQRYISPAFLYGEDGRVMRMVNAALTSMPATHDAVPLAASVHSQDTRIKKLALATAACMLAGMDPEKIKAALAAIESGDAEAALSILKDMIAAAAGGGEDSDPEAAPVEPLAEAADEEPAEDDPSKPADEMSALSVLTSLTGKASVSEAATVLRGHVARVEQIDREHKALDLSARRGLIAELVKLNVETPATAWEGDASKRMPVKRLADESIESMRARVDHIKRTRPASHEAPTVDEGDVAAEVKTLSAATLKQIKVKGMTPEEFIHARRSAVRRVPSGRAAAE